MNKLAIYDPEAVEVTRAEPHKDMAVNVCGPATALVVID